VVASTRPVSTTIRSTSTTSTVVPTTTSTVALSSVTSVAAKLVEDLQKAEQKLTSIQAQSTALSCVPPNSPSAKPTLECSTRSPRSSWPWPM
jgi:hypothetical protein